LTGNVRCMKKGANPGKEGGVGKKSGRRCNGPKDTCHTGTRKEKKFVGRVCAN